MDWKIVFAKYAAGILIISAMTLAQNLCKSRRRDAKMICYRSLPLKYRFGEECCCEIQQEAFQSKWYKGGYYLSRHMELLRTWRCPQLEEECRNRLYEFGEFNRLIYEKFCNQTKLERECSSELENVLPKAKSETKLNAESSVSDSNSRWDELVLRLNASMLDTEDIVKPCVQIAQLDSPDSGFGEYHEIVVTVVPFCPITWCGFSSAVVNGKDGIRPFDCMSHGCRANIILSMTVVILLSIAIVIANIIIIVVFSATPKLQNSQSAFKISLAVADLLVGIFVLPSFAINLSKLTLQPAKMGEIIDLPKEDLVEMFVNWSKVPMTGRDGYTLRRTTGGNVFEDGYILYLGFMTNVSVLVSMYTLAAAGFDRLFAICTPLHYRRKNTKKIANRVTIGIWLLSILLSLMPFMASSLRYSISSSTVAILSGPNVQIYYIVAFLVPLIIVWLTNFTIFVSVHRQAQKRKEIVVGNTQGRDSNTEARLAITLAIMVGTFTLCVLPAAINSAVSLTMSEGVEPSIPSEFDPDKDRRFNSADFVMAVILMCNSLWNCFIYSGRNKEFRKAFKEVLQRIRRAVILAKERTDNQKPLKSRSRVMATTTTTAAATTMSSTPISKRVDTQIVSPSRSNQFSSGTESEKSTERVA